MFTFTVYTNWAVKDKLVFLDWVIPTHGHTRHISPFNSRPEIMACGCCSAESEHSLNSSVFWVEYWIKIVGYQSFVVVAAFYTPFNVHMTWFMINICFSDDICVARYFSYFFPPNSEPRPYILSRIHILRADNRSVLPSTSIVEDNHTPFVDKFNGKIKKIKQTTGGKRATKKALLKQTEKRMKIPTKFDSIVCCERAFERS